MSERAATVLLVPGLWNSGPEHWQSHWERERGDCVRVQQRDWENPDRAEWVAALDAAVAARPGTVVIAAHSLGCATVAHWAGSAGAAVRARVCGALLVAPADVERPDFPAGATGFAPMPRDALPFESIVVCSENDEYVSAERAREFADAWGSRMVHAGALGHINSESRLGMWPLGQAMLARLGV